MVKIIKEGCVGCGICANICPEGIEMINGKAKIKNENMDCLKSAADACPRNAILLNGEKSGNKEADNKPTRFGQGIDMRRGFGMGTGVGRGMGQGRGKNRKW